MNHPVLTRRSAVQSVLAAAALAGAAPPARATASDRIIRYGLAVEQRFSPEVIYLLTHAMQRVVSEGTATALLSSPLKDRAIAGKTGTSDNFRDSWFAGFTGDHLAVVWLGRDDNTSINLSGSAGALKVWEKIMREVVSSPLKPVEPEAAGRAVEAGGAEVEDPAVGRHQPVAAPVRGRHQVLDRRVER